MHGLWSLKMDFRLIYLREGRTYGAEELRRCVQGQLSATGEYTSWLDGEFFKRLATSMNNGIAFVNESNGMFKFGFIGLYDYTDKETGKNLTFFFMPKFCDIGDGKDVAAEKRDAVLLAIDRYAKEMKLPEVQGDQPEEQDESLLELAVRVLRDYLENGVYTVQRRELEHNGQGEIDWEMTIDQYQPIFMDERPAYMDTATELAFSDENHYITRLHQCLVTAWGRKLEELGLSSVLRVNVPLLSEDELEHFGPKEFQLDQIRKELSVQFVTKSRNTLTLMRDLIERSSSSETELVEQMSFGMNKAEHLWEEACAAVLGSELDEEINKYGLSWENGVTFREYMPRPIWQPFGNGPVLRNEDVNAYKNESEKSGWRLDFIRTWPPQEKDEKKVDKLVILDAKYYNVSWNNSGQIQGQPGIGDIAKQIFYQKAFEDLVKENQDIVFVNAFLFPEDDEKCKDGEGCVAAKVSEKVWLGWSDKKRASAFKDVNLFAVRLPGIELLRRYAHYEAAEEWFSAIANSKIL